MSKMRVRGTLVTLVFLAAVAVFPSVGEGLRSQQTSRKAAACEFRDTGMLVADGGDPVPGPSPIPWPKQPA
ncbi:MAG TPA: hypothetical protein VJN92_04255 [Candidatus Acidoferrum sp.]|nr:hypothetical protein [Candidatus Acidoferrum sp.]